MILSVLVGLVVISLVVTVERAILSGWDDKLRAAEYCYRFHRLRDELQMMVIQRKLETSSLTYNFLMQSLNFAIRNAGTMKLREILEIANKVKERVEAAHFDAICEDIAKHDTHVSDLAGHVFSTISEILIANDRLVCIGVAVYRTIKKSMSFISPILRAVNSIVTPLFRVLTPMRVDAIDSARQYEKWASKIGSC
jgi:hypothetical protein